MITDGQIILALAGSIVFAGLLNATETDGMARVGSDALVVERETCVLVCDFTREFGAQVVQYPAFFTRLNAKWARAASKSFGLFTIQSLAEGEISEARVTAGKTEGIADCLAILTRERMRGFEQKLVFEAAKGREGVRCRYRFAPKNAAAARGGMRFDWMMGSSEINVIAFLDREGQAVFERKTGWEEVNPSDWKELADRAAMAATRGIQPVAVLCLDREAGLGCAVVCSDSNLRPDLRARLGNQYVASSVRRGTEEAGGQDAGVIEGAFVFLVSDTLENLIASARRAMEDLSVRADRPGAARTSGGP